MVTVNGTVSVKDENGAAAPGASVAVKWTLPNSAIQNQTANTDSGGSAKFSVKAGRGTYKLTVTNISRATAPFDAANSVLTGTISR